MDPQEEVVATRVASPAKAGTITRIKLENFMCHRSLSIEFIDYVNFITGQNGSGKSAILTALCVAFGIKARGTQRATTLKEFIKNGCSQALVVVEMKNEGVDAFRPDLYGKKITIERKITESGNASVLKDWQGKKVASRKEDLQELVDHFNIDVENPCVIMTQDKSREFLHAGSGKEKFKFFFRATLLQQVKDLLSNIDSNIEAAEAIVGEMEQELQPLVEGIKHLEEKLKVVEHYEEMKQQFDVLRRMLPWSEVYDVDRKLNPELAKLQKCQNRKPTCEDRIKKSKEALEKVQADHVAKKVTIASLLEKTEGLQQRKNELQKNLSEATKEKVHLEEEQSSRQRYIRQKLEGIRWLQQQIRDIHDRSVQASQAEKVEREEGFHKLQNAIDESAEEVKRLQEIEFELESKVNATFEEIKLIREEMEEKKREHIDLQTQVRRLESQLTNKVTAFGGDSVLRLLQIIERHHQKFKKPPLGPIGAHVALTGDDNWAFALEVAIGKLLNAFVVTCHEDLLILRDCAKSCGYHNLQIIIYDFERPLLSIPEHMLPDHGLATVMSVLYSEIPTIMNVLIDQGSVERQVLVKDYDAGKIVVFERRSPNVKEAYTMDGVRMFTRGGTQTTLPPDTRIRSGRLCAAVDDQISHVEEEILKISGEIRSAETWKYSSEANLQKFKDQLHNTKRRRVGIQRRVTAQELHLRDLKNSAQDEATIEQDSNVDELEQEILKEQLEVQSREDSLEKLKIRLDQAQEKIDEAMKSVDILVESFKDDIQALQDAENALVSIEETMVQAAGAVEHFKNIMEVKIIPEIIQQENKIAGLRKERERKFKEASSLFPEEEVAGMDFTHVTPELIRTRIARLEERIRREEGRHDESADQLRSKIHKRTQRKEGKQRKFQFYREKLEMLRQALSLRHAKFQRNATLLKRQLHWQFNGHLRKKGMSGKIQVDLSSETLSIQVQMPQDSSVSMVRDTRGLSGGERSFSTLCFVLALHEMTEAPFRAMDEFDVFMDAVSRKISLDTAVDFAASHGCQWIFITPHDISMVKTGPCVKKQQMAAPRP
eukprot:c28410_g1_i1 orf=301-3471(+)